MAEHEVGQYFLLFEIFFVYTFNHNFGKCWWLIDAQNWRKKSTVPPTPKAKKVNIQVVQLFSLSLFFLWRLKETKSKIGKENHFRPISSPPQKWEFYHVYLFSFSFNIIIRNSLQIWSFLFPFFVTFECFMSMYVCKKITTHHHPSSWCHLWLIP